jgi:hypothetical protein
MHAPGTSSGCVFFHLLENGAYVALAPEWEVAIMATRNGPQSHNRPQGRDTGGGGERQKPAHEYRCGRIKGTIWRQEGKESPWFSVSIVRSYVDGNKQWKTAATFGKDDLLVVAEVARHCWQWIAANGNGKSDGEGGDDVPFDDQF